MYIPVAQRNKPTAKTGYVPVANRIQSVATSTPNRPPRIINLTTDDDFKVGVTDVIRELPTGAKRVGTFLKELVAPSRGYTEQELRTAQPTKRQLVASVPKVVAEFSSAIGSLLSSSDRSLAYKFAQTSLGGKLADVGAKIEEFGKPKNVGEAKAMRIADIVTALPAGTMKVSLTGAQTIARTKNLKTIVNVLKKEIPDLSDEAAEAFGRVFVDMDNADEIQRAVNKIDFSVSNARKSVKKTPYVPVAQRQTPISPRIAPQKAVQVAEDPLLTEARKYKSAEEFVEAQGTPMYRGDATPIKLSEMDTTKVFNPSEKEALGAFNNTPGLYFTDSVTNAKSYGKNLTEVSVKPTANVINVSDAPKILKRADVERIIKSNPRIKDWATNWDENFDKAIKQITDSVMAEKDGNEFLKAIWSDGGFSEGDFVKAMQNAGIDGLKVPKEGVNHFVIYNKDALQTKSQLIDIWKKAQGKQLPTPEGLPKLPKATDQTIGGVTDIGRAVPQKIQTLETSAKRPSPRLGIETATQPKLELRTTLPENVPQASRVVKGDAPTVRLSEESYEANHARLSQKTGRIQRIKESLGAATRSIGEGADKLLGTISTRLKNIDPSLKKAIRDFEFNLANNTQKDRKAVEPFLRAIRNKDIPLRDYADLDLALKNGDAVKTQEIIKRYGLEEEFATVRATLEDLYRRAESVGYDIGYERNYFPRMIEDSAGLLEYLQKGDDWSIIDEAIRAKETELGRYLSVDEKANVINTLVRGYPTGKVTLSETGAMKARRIDIVDAELNQFYRDSVESLLRYIDSTNDAIEARRFFGKGKVTDEFANVEDSIGSYILNLMAEGKVKPSQEKELGEILRARFAAKGTSGITRVYKNLSYIDTMGSVTSAITQLGDLAFAIYKGGPVRAAKALGKAIVGKSELTRTDIGIEKIAQEFQDSSRSANAVTKVFKLVGLEKLDALGKETVINASIDKLRALAKEPTTEFVRKLEAVFGNDADTLTRVVDDLKTGKVTEDTKLLAFNELLDVQPVALSEMPEMYLKGGNGRIFYMLKTYTIKLFDVYRNEIFSQIRTNPLQATKNLIYLTGSLLLMNATADEIKDFILNRETSLKDRTVDNILKLAGFSKFTIYKAREEGIGSAVAKTILPPFKFIDSAYKDITQANEISQLETIQSIPIAGKLYYWWFGKGATKTEKKRKKESGTTSRLKTPPGLPELPGLKSNLPSLPKLPSLSL